MQHFQAAGFLDEVSRFAADSGQTACTATVALLHWLGHGARNCSASSNSHSSSLFPFFQSLRPTASYLK